MGINNFTLRWISLQCISQFVRNTLTNWLTISHTKKLYEDHFSLEQGSLSLLLFVFLLFWCFVNAFKVIITCMKTLVIWLSCKTPSVPCNACTTTSVTYTLHHVYTMHLVLVITCNLPFLKCMLAMWQWLDPRLPCIISATVLQVSSNKLLTSKYFAAQIQTV